MIKCPRCGSTAQVRMYGYDTDIDMEEIKVRRYYLCKGCGILFETDQFYRSNGYEMLAPEEDEDE